MSLRQRSGQDGLFTDSCGYDETRKQLVRTSETWNPLAPKPTGHHTVEEGSEELAKIEGDTCGLRLKRDGTSFRLRLQEKDMA